ncbi:MAG: spermidine/putrescine ABC transporter substrate-binding protein [Proteobacteria bacterium]|nr:spermidine/putrescine ABC transporter substrate-binding protein [Pseudomonadota bacterium]MBU4298104.1 spermidine/putrescine ABC transporter substrate-binding protein [Pseudomonadota bacterium]MCG2747388.1 spermidine/putrescine ABC transporter substrate-binding protein [Desulfobulbaceae bacterium]
MHATVLKKFLPLLFFWLAVLCGNLAGIGKASAGEGSDNQLQLLNWSEYFDPEVLAEFQKKFGITVTETYYETDEMRNEILFSTNGTGYDLILSNGSSIATYVKHTWLAPISEKDIPNLQHVSRKWRTSFPESEQYGVPFLWGTLGIAYRTDQTTKPVTSWMDLFRPEEAVQGKIIMIKDSRDLVGMALKALGYSVNSTDNRELDEAKQLLLAQKPAVKTYSYVTLGENSSMVSGDAFMAMIYNGDALVLQQHDKKIAFVQPRDGCLLWCDFFVIPASSKKKELACKFLNFIHEPAIMARLAQFASYATTNKAAEKLLPQEFRDDHNIYPPKEILEKSETYADLPPRVAKKYNDIFNLVIQ